MPRDLGIVGSEFITTTYQVLENGKDNLPKKLYLLAVAMYQSNFLMSLSKRFQKQRLYIVVKDSSSYSIKTLLICVS